MLNLPAEIEGEKVADHENFVIEPFVSLSKLPEHENVQVIAAGSAFKGLHGAHRHRFTEVVDLTLVRPTDASDPVNVAEEGEVHFISHFPHGAEATKSS